MPKSPEKYTVVSEVEWDPSPEAGTNTEEDHDFSASSTIQPHLITPAELKDLAPDLDLPKNQYSASWIVASAVESSRKGRENVIL